MIITTFSNIAIALRGRTAYEEEKEEKKKTDDSSSAHCEPTKKKRRKRLMKVLLSINLGELRISLFEVECKFSLV